MSLLRPAAAVAVIAALAACGVKAPPRPPEKAGAPAVPPPAAEQPASCEDGCGRKTSSLMPIPSPTSRPGVERVVSQPTTLRRANVSRVGSRPTARPDGAA